jgi:general secretion pathway protein E
LVISDFLRPLVMERADAATIRHAATTHDMTNLRDDGAEKVLAGLTTVEEVVRVTQEEGI